MILPSTSHSFFLPHKSVGERGWSGAGCGCPVWWRGDGPCFLQRRAAIKAPTPHPHNPRPYASEGLGKGCDEQLIRERRAAIKAPTPHPHGPRPCASEGLGKGCDEKPAYV